MVAIFMFSAASAAESDSESGRVITFLLKVAGIDLSSYSEEAAAAILSSMNLYVRKGAHFTEFAALGFSLLHFLDLLHIGFSVFSFKRNMIYSVIAGIVYAFSDEFHQFFSDGRAPGIIDVLIDSAGVTAGVIFCRLLLLIFLSIKSKRSVRGTDTKK